MSSLIDIKRVMPPHIRGHKGAASPLVCLTSSSAPLTRLLDPHCDLLLVGDSLGMVLYGMETTLGVDLETMIRHSRAVASSARHACIVVDMPFGSCQETPQAAFRNCARVLAETGASAVKFEGGREMAETIAFLTARGIPVLAHIGLMPQHFNAKGGYKVQGHGKADADAILEDARAVAEAGAFAVVIEGVVEPLARKVTSSVEIPTIGIGASRACDGQILVAEDMLGLTPGPHARFVKKYADLSGTVGDAVRRYAEDVRTRAFPGDEHVYADTKKDQK